jgi:hypothetical protein
MVVAIVGERRVGDGTGTAGRSPLVVVLLLRRGSCNGRTFGLIVTADEDGDNMGEDDEGAGVEVEAADVEEKVRILEDGNAYLPVPVVVAVADVVVLLLPEFDIIDLCKFPDDFFFNPPAGNGGNDFSLFNNIPPPLVDDIIGGAAGLKISFGVLGIGMLSVEEVDEGVFPLQPLLLLLLLLSC